jgi:flavodoxin
MKTLIVCVSVSHTNTKKVARVMAEVLDASIVEPEEVDLATIGDYDLVGFGSGIYFMAFHPRLRQLVRSLPRVTNRKAFVFSTSGSREPPRWGYTRRLHDRLAVIGYDVVGSFSCRGYDTWLPLRLVGGINKGRPDSADLERARAFARSLVSPTPSPPPCLSG